MNNETTALQINSTMLRIKNQRTIKDWKIYVKACKWYILRSTIEKSYNDPKQYMKIISVIISIDITNTGVSPIIIPTISIHEWFIAKAISNLYSAQSE